MITAKKFVEKAITYEKLKTTYVWGTFGWPVTEANIERACRQYPSMNNKRKATMQTLLDVDAWMFDCVGYIKALLWGFSGSGGSYGGGTYASGGVPDIDADTMINRCSGVSTDFSNIVPGEVVWKSGHIGIYIGDRKVVECTPAWENGVQITACGNLGKVTSLNTTTWTKHGKLPYVDYGSTGTTTSTAAAKPAASTGKATTKPEPAALFNRQYARPYTTTADLNLRLGASVKKPIIRTLAKGETVTCYGYYSINGSTVWLSVRDKKGNEGFCSKAYLR